MYKNKKIACIIPARLASSRFKEKVLKHLGSKPILQWIYESAKESELFDCIVFAVDAVQTKDLVESFGGTALMTSVSCLTGTDRLIEAKDNYQIEADVFVNWQADEPFIKKPLLLDLLQSVDTDADVWTLKKEIQDVTKLEDPSIVKVVTGKDDKALYFSRHSIPYPQNEVGLPFFKHLGIYAYTSDALDKIKTLTPCLLEKAESLEQLRFLYHGLKMKVHTTEHESLGIDLEEHLELAKQQVAIDPSFT
ncbi:MAG: 3-deoxy-manno-octulosonate cytidylyltransferase [Chlamydiia bacterium]|nr:3-deoxy-manno-octulosonate cytidylyltransferase [Chlamydiia bacterium]